MRFALLAVLTACFLVTPSLLTAQVKEATGNPGLRLFQKHVRADLIHHCLECHGGNSIKADFDLSTREALMDSGYVGDSAADSHLMELITHAAEPRMPFKKPKLSNEITTRIAKWIELGAPYDAPLSDKQSRHTGPMVVTDEDRTFWSFQPLTKPTTPDIGNKAWCRTDIDRFIMAELERQGLIANPDADNRTLRRRAWFGLVGLPPTATDPDEGYEYWVDQLLASPHYGERWARHWMDVARFAESYGYEQDYDRPNAYHYRDFLIKAFNADMPFDQFVRWQLAGDEFAPHDPLAMMATGFLGAGVFPTQLTEAEFESTRYDELDDMTATTGVAFLGLSVGCARCHDHKFDPIPTRDYYRFAATFTKTIRSEIELDLHPEANEQRRTDFAVKTQQLEEALRAYEAGPLKDAFAVWQESDGNAISFGPWVTLKPVRIESKTNYEVQPDHAILAKGKATDKDVVTVYANSISQPITALRVEALTHDSMPRKGPGLADNGNFVLSSIEVHYEVTQATQQTAEEAPSVVARPVKATAIKLSGAKATHQQNTGALSVAASTDDDPVSGWAVDSGGIGKDQAAVFTFEETLRPAEQGTLRIQLTFNHPNSRHAMGRFRISVSGHENAPVVVGGSGPDAATVAAIEAVQQGSAEEQQKNTALSWFRTTQPEWTELSKSIDDHRAAGPEIKMTKVQINSENVPKLSHHANGRGYPHFYETTHLLDRGDVNQKTEVVKPGLLQVLNPEKANSEQWTVNKPENANTEFSRASLAQWLTDPNNVSGQLVARVIVNRIWQHHFGRGIVATPNDFGFQGERPTHPELLDWLAADLIEHGWKLKRLHKLIMLSSVYRQSSNFHSQRSKIDPDNRLLWRRTPRRLEGEAIRDSMLTVSGQLDTTMYGPGTLNANMKRRSIYFFIKRSKLIPTMMLFDWPEHLVSIGQRSTTTIAPQALMFMNSSEGRQFAETFAAQLSKTDSVTDAYRRAFGREPSKQESLLATAFLKQQTDVYEQTGNTKASDLALADFCQTLFSMNEFIYVD